MLKKFEDPKLDSAFYLTDSSDAAQVMKKSGSHLKLLWNRSEGVLNLLVDQSTVQLKSQQVMCCTYLQEVILPTDLEDIVVLSFNRSFYCIHTQDVEVSCNGLLFFGSDYAPVITLDPGEAERLGTLIGVLQDEFDTIDRNQEEMLRILLKRFIIRCTRIARMQLSKTYVPDQQMDIIRQFNVLVEEHFRTLRQVGDYADLLHRSPKTITNVFSMHSDKSPLQVIHDRVILEAKRQLLYTDKSSKQIAHELGFDDPSQFSRFFKKLVSETTQEFREKNQV
jgi:AraC-like DNA-binding protein